MKDRVNAARDQWGITEWWLLTNLAVRSADYKLAEQIACLLVKQEAVKKLYQLSQKERPVKSLSL